LSYNHQKKARGLTQSARLAQWFRALTARQWAVGRLVGRRGKHSDNADLALNRAPRCAVTQPATNLCQGGVLVFSLGLVSVNQHGGSGACDEHPELVAVWPDVAGSAARRPMDLRSGLAR